MRKRIWLSLSGLLLLVIVIAICVPVLVTPAPGVTHANFSRIEKGMTSEQVQRCLGKPNPHKHIEFFFELSLATRGTRLEFDDPWRNWSHWTSDADDLVAIHFDEHGHVNDAIWNGVRDDRTGLEKLRDRLPWIERNPPPRLRLHYKKPGT